MAKRTAIEEAKDLNVLSLENLIGSLLSHEEVLKQMNSLHDRKNKSIAFNSVCANEGEKLDEEFENELALTSKKLQRMMKFKHDQNAKRGSQSNGYSLRPSGNMHNHSPRTFGHHSGSSNDKNSFATNIPDTSSKDVKSSTENKSDSTICFKCVKTGHIRVNCPLNKRKEKAMAATWSDYSSEEESDNIAFMGLNSNNEDVNANDQVWSD
ncbi:unnamed protein product [Linum trigynum]|uniref:CCHC-type domain-containing protein n=1 Tax=Linum trigynum TaxID=586398 RepID=A0AAV2CB91_9ROSI